VLLHLVFEFMRLRYTVYDTDSNRPLRAARSHLGGYPFARWTTAGQSRILAIRTKSRRYRCRTRSTWRRDRRRRMLGNFGLSR
jgi:hypothetical protein